MTQRIRVLTYLHSFELGGVERIALRLVRAWRAAGFDAPLLMGRADGPMRAELAKDLDFRLARPAPFAARTLEMLWLTLRLYGEIRRTRPDVLFCAGNTYAVHAVVLKLLLGRRCPPVVAKISNDLERVDMPPAVRSIYRAWLRMQGRFIDHWVSMDESMQDEIMEATGALPETVTTIPDPAVERAQIQALRAAPRPAPARGRRFVAIGRLAPQKDFPTMLRAFARGATAEDTLTLFGNGGGQDELATLARHLGIADRVEFAGYRADAASLLPQYHVLLLSSIFEGVPAVIIEALAAGMPIVATDCSRGVRALLRDGQLGALVPIGDVGAFARAIRDARPGSQNARASLDQARRFTIESAADAYLRCFAVCVSTTHAEPELAERIAA